MEQGNSNDFEKPHSKSTGIAHLCFITLPSDEGEYDEHAHPKDRIHVSGYFIDKTTKKSYGIVGELSSKEEWQNEPCCYQKDDPPVWFLFTIIDYSNKKDYKVIVEKTGGDFLKLEAKKLSFITETLKTDREAEEHIKKYFPKLSSINGYLDRFVCIGQMTLYNLLPLQSSLDISEEPTNKYETWKPISKQSNEPNKEMEEMERMEDDIDLLDD